MGNVIGPIAADDWYTMRELKGAIRYYRERRDPRFDRVIGKYSKLYQTCLGEYVGRAA